MTEFVEDDDTTIETLQKSIYHLREDKFKSLNKVACNAVLNHVWLKNVLIKSVLIQQRSSIHRVVLVSRINPACLESKKKIISFFEEYLHEFAESEPITGLLLIYPLHVLNIIETSLDHLHKIFSVLANHHTLCQEFGEEESTKWILSHTKILNISYDIHQRLYQLYSSRILDMGPANLELYEPGESDDKIVIDLITMVTKLGAYLVKEPNKDIESGEFVIEVYEVKLNEILDNIRDNVPHLIPQQVVIGYLSTVSEHSCLVTPANYLAQYEKPYDRALESEYTWPITEKMFPYH